MASETADLSMTIDKRLVVVVALPSPEGAALVQLVASAIPAWRCEQVTPDEVARRPEVLAAAAAIVVATGSGCNDVLAVFPPDVPVIAFGASWPSSRQPSSWFPRPSAAVLHAVLHETLSPHSTPGGRPGAAPGAPASS
jgi:hypothetical protein